MENQTEKKEKNNDHGRVFASWKFMEMPQYKRGPVWYFVAGMIVILFIAYAIYTKNYLFALIILLFVALFFIVYKNVRQIDAEITEDGISVGKKFYTYTDIVKFWIIYEPPEIKNAYFRLKHTFPPLLMLPLEDQNPSEIRKILLHYLKEDTRIKDESLTDTWARILKL